MQTAIMKNTKYSFSLLKAITVLTVPLCFPPVVAGRVYVAALATHFDELSSLKQHIASGLRYLALNSPQVLKCQ